MGTGVSTLTMIEYVAIAVASALSLAALYAVGLLYLKWTERRER